MIFRLPARTHIALGLSAIVTTALLVAVFIGLLPDRVAAIRDGRIALAESVAATSTALIAANERRRLEAVLRFLIERNPELVSAGVRDQRGELVAVGGDHSSWTPVDSGLTTDRQMQVPLYSEQRRWGQLELRFRSIIRPGWRGVLDFPGLALGLFVFVVCLTAFELYLGRVLRHLDPARAIPGRVRAALDTLTEGLLVLDRNGNVVLANQAIADILGRAPEKLIGTDARRLGWLTLDSAAADASVLPWRTALESGTVQRNGMIRLPSAAGSVRTFLVNASPVLGAGAKPGGVLVSLEDITELEKKELELQVRSRRGRSGQPREERVPGQHEPRDPHADERDPRLHRAAAARLGQGRARVERTTSTRSTRSGKHLLATHQRHPGPVEGRGGAARGGAHRLLAARGRAARRWSSSSVKAREKAIGLSIHRCHAGSSDASARTRRACARS